MANVLELLSWICAPVGALLFLVAAAIAIVSGTRKPVTSRLVRIDEYALWEWQEPDGRWASRAATPEEIAHTAGRENPQLYRSRDGAVHLVATPEGHRLALLLGSILLGVGIVCAVVGTVVGAL